MLTKEASVTRHSLCRSLQMYELFLRGQKESGRICKKESHDAKKITKCKKSNVMYLLRHLVSVLKERK